MEIGNGDGVSDENLGEGHGYVGRDLLAFNNKTWKSVQLTVMIALLLYIRYIKLQSFNNLSSAKHPDEWQEHRYKLPNGSIANYILFFKAKVVQY